MNTHLTTSSNGLALLMDFEKGDPDVALTENGGALEPYVCPGGELTIGYGCTKWFDGSDVAIHHRLKNESECVALLEMQLTAYEEAVRRYVTREMDQHAFDAFVCLAFNIGVGNFSADTCSARTAFINGRREDAAANFGKWTGSTCERPPTAKWFNPAPYEVAGQIKLDHKGSRRWVGPDGQYCRYMLRYDGLLYRHYAEALLLMGKDFRLTLSSTLPKAARYQLSLTPKPPSQSIWNATKNRWEEQVESRTPFKQVFTEAYAYDLPEGDLILSPASVASADKGGEAVATSPAVASSPLDEDEWLLEGAQPAAPVPAPQNPPPANPSAVPQAGSDGKGGAPSVPAPPPTPVKETIAPKPSQTVDVTKYNINNIKVENGAKPLEGSDRAVAFAIKFMGLTIKRGAAIGVVPVAASDFYFDIFGDPFITAFVIAGVVWCIGELVEWIGHQKRKKHEATASTLLY